MPSWSLKLTEVHWLPGIITLLVAAGAGAFCVGLLRRSTGNDAPAHGEPPNAGETQLRIDDLLQRRQQLMRALRDSQDRSKSVAVDTEEVRDLELRAARVFKALAEAEQGAAAKPIEASSVASPPDPMPSRDADTPTAASKFAAFKWMAVGAFLPLVAISLYFGISERKDDMTPMTGGNPALSGPMSAATGPEAGQPGAPVPGVPPDLRPKASPLLDQARARVSAHPDDAEAWAALGWALVEAGGWIDVFETARRLKELAPSHPDSFVLQASVRIAMGQHELAQQLITDALTLAPSHIQGLSFQGALAMQRGDREAAAAAWQRAMAVAGPGNGFEELIAMAQSEARAPALPADHPPPRSAGASANSAPLGAGGSASTARPRGSSASTAGAAAMTAADAVISGQVVLGAGTTFDGPGIVFIIARPKGVHRGPPAAAKRLTVTSFPLAFSISSADAMMGGGLPPEVSLSARLDADGNAGTRSADDLVSEATDVVVGTAEVVLQLRPPQ